MNNPLKLLGIILVGIISIPIVLSVLTYKPINIDDNEILMIRKEINYETVDKKAPIIKLYHHESGSIEKIDIEEYLIGAVASEMPSDFNEEALKAQAVAARTYVIHQQESGGKSGHNGADVCTDHAHCQAYQTYEQLKKIKGDEWMETEYQKIKNAVDKTKGQIITFESNAILPMYFSTSSGKTENSQEVFAVQEPYLVSVSSEYDKISPKYTSDLIMSTGEFVDIVQKSYKNLEIDTKNLQDEIEIISNSEGGSVNEIRVGNLTLQGRDIRTLLNLNSSNFDIDIKNNTMNFTVKGYGHGVGMSQWGANGMANEGYKYYEIIKHYYTGVDITDTY